MAFRDSGSKDFGNIEPETKPIVVGLSGEPKPPLAFKTHEKCPVCGSQEREGEKIFARLREEGYVGEKTPLEQIIQVQVMDQEKLQKQAVTSLTGKVKIKMIGYHWDVCSNCGNMYVTKTEVTDVDAKLQMQQAPAPQGGFRNIPGMRGGRIGG